MSNCIGKCCTDFTMRIPPMQIPLMKRRLERGVRILHDRGTYAGWTDPISNKLGMILEMIEFRFMDQREPTNGENSGGRIFHYRCKNYVDGKCSVYADRPPMCRNFAWDENQPCRYRGCKEPCRPNP